MITAFVDEYLLRYFKNNKVNGNIETHRNYREIKAFCDKYEVKILCLHSGYIEDVGSIIPLTE